MTRSYSPGTLLQLRERVPRPQSPDPSLQQEEAIQNGSKVCTRTRVNVNPIPFFALSSEESESESESDGVYKASERRIVRRHQGRSPHDSPPFAWSGDQLTRFEDLSASICKIHSNERNTWWSIVLLESCARAGCPRCNLRLPAIFKIIGRDRIGPDWQYSEVQIQDSIITLKFKSGIRGPEKNTKKAPFFPWASHPIQIELYTSPDQYPRGWTPFLSTGRDVMQDRRTSCPKLIMGWLHSCATCHVRCGQYIDSLPTRVIDVGTSEAPNVYLRSTLGVRGPYIVLSYSFDGWWRAPKTTKDNFHRRMQGIPLSELPSIFQDAVHVVRGLGLQYLWIDSLCIVQDDENDISANVSSMASIYSNALFVLGAYRPSSPTKNGPPMGLLAARCDNPRGEAFAHVESRDGTVSKVQARLLGKPHGHFCGVARSVGYGVWSRAWAVQEQLLASRMVHFTEHELFWECRCVISCECMELDRSTVKTTLHKKHWFNKLLEMPVRGDFYRFWWYMLCTYSSRTFVSGSEVLLAISALARRMQQCGADLYYAGMWKNDLPHGLLWERKTPIFKASQEYIAPSWSWASRITYPPNIYSDKHDFGELGPTTQISSPVHKEDLEEVYASVIDVDITPASMGVLGPVSSGQITLCGLLIKAKFRVHPLTYHEGSTRVKMSLIHPLFLDGTPVWTTPDFDPMPSDVGDDLLLILIVKERGRSKKMRYTRYRGLMLSKLKDYDRYKRIGTWEVPVINEYNDIEAKDFFQNSRIGEVRVV